MCYCALDKLSPAHRGLPQKPVSGAQTFYDFPLDLRSISIVDGSSGWMRGSGSCLLRLTARMDLGLFLDGGTLVDKYSRFSHLAVKDLVEARDQFHVHLMNKKNVVATAIGRYLIRREDIDRHGNYHPPSDKGNAPRPKRPIENGIVIDIFLALYLDIRQPMGTPSRASQTKRRQCRTQDDLHARWTGRAGAC